MTETEAKEKAERLAAGKKRVQHPFPGLST